MWIENTYGDAKDAELKRLWDAKVHVAPFGVGVATPMTREVATTCERRSVNEEGSFASENLLESIVRCSSADMSVEIVQVVLSAVVRTIRVCGIG